MLQTVSIGLIILSLSFSFFGTEHFNNFGIFGLAGTGLAAIAGFFSLSIRTEYPNNFKESDWIASSDENGPCVKIEIPRKIHELGKLASVTAYMKNETGFELIGLNVYYNENGDIRIECSKPFIGKYLIK